MTDDGTTITTADTYESDKAANSQQIGFFASNTTAGNLARAAMKVASNSSTGYFQAYSSSFVGVVSDTVGVIADSDASGGIFIDAEASAPIAFRTNATARGVVDSSGHFCLENVTSCTGQVVVGTQSQHLHTTQSTAPTVTAGGCSSPAITTKSTDQWGEVSVGTGCTTQKTITVSFHTTWTNAPFCTANFSAGATIQAVEVGPTTTTLVLSVPVAFSANDKLQWMCGGVE